MGLILAIIFAVNSNRSGAVSADLWHFGGFCLQVPVLHPNLRSEKFFQVRAALALQHSLPLCCRHTNGALINAEAEQQALMGQKFSTKDGKDSYMA